MLKVLVHWLVRRCGGEGSINDSTARVGQRITTDHSMALFSSQNFLKFFVTSNLWSHTWSFKYRRK
jgi:hypothetical protein